MNNDLMFSSKNNQWCTPKDFFNKLNDEFDFNLDPCCLPRSALCKKYYTPEEDGLKQDWGGYRVFVNPPYGKDIKYWVKKSYEESRKKNTVVVMLIPARTDTAYFHEYILGKAEIRFIRGRIKFVDMDNPQIKNSAPFPSILVIYKNA